MVFYDFGNKCQRIFVKSGDTRSHTTNVRRNNSQNWKNFAASNSKEQAQESTEEHSRWWD